MHAADNATVPTGRTEPTHWDDLLASMRPKHWVKNILVFTALVFAHKLLEPMSVAKTVAAFCAFSMLSSAGYLVNDLHDRTNDVHHPTKKYRPIAQGRLGYTSVVGWWVVLIAIGLTVSFLVETRLFYVALTFVAVNLAYTFWLKNVVIVDAFAIAAGFMLRTAAGAVAIQVPISSWLLICTLLLSLFLGLTKRSLELKVLEESAPEHRPSLAQYNPYLLDRMSSVITSAILITYTLYTLSDATADKFEGHGLFATVPVVLYGIFRYLYLLHQKKVTSTLEAALVSDRPMMVALGIFVLVAFGAIYL